MRPVASSLLSILTLIGCEGSVLLSLARNESELHIREKRQLGQLGQLGMCSWGQPAVSACHNGVNGRYCNLGYQCDLRAGNDGQGRCCLPGVGGGIKPGGTGTNTGIVTMPPCRDGNLAVALCLNGNCGAGLICSTTDNYCCLSGTSASCNFVGFPSGRCNNGGCAVGQYCSRDGYCCQGTNPNIGGVNPGGNVGNLGTCPFNAPSGGTCSEVSQCQPGYACIQNVCCMLTSLRCNNGVTTPTGGCIAGQCPQWSNMGSFQAQQCQQPYNICCPV